MRLLLNGFGVVLTWYNVGLMMVGILIGVIVGVLQFNPRPASRIEHRGQTAETLPRVNAERGFPRHGDSVQRVVLDDGVSHRPLFTDDVGLHKFGSGAGAKWKVDYFFAKYVPPVKDAHS